MRNKEQHKKEIQKRLKLQAKELTFNPQQHPYFNNQGKKCTYEEWLKEVVWGEGDLVQQYFEENNLDQDWDDLADFRDLQHTMMNKLESDRFEKYGETLQYKIVFESQNGRKQECPPQDSMEEIWYQIKNWDLPDNYTIDGYESVQDMDDENFDALNRIIGNTSFPLVICYRDGDAVAYPSTSMQAINEFYWNAHFHDCKSAAIVECQAKED